MTREELIDLIESRIKSEYKKHGDLDWAGIAARKIYSSLKQSGALCEAVIEPRLCDGVVSSCVDKDELISDLDDRRAVGVEMNEDMWYFCRKQSAEYLLDKYKLLRK